MIYKMKTEGKNGSLESTFWTQKEARQKDKTMGFFCKKKKKNNHDIERILKFNVRTNFLHSYRCLIFRHNIF